MANKKNKKNLVCPKCHRYFADLDTSDYPAIDAKHVMIVAGRRHKLKDGDSLACTFCGYEYLTPDIVLACASPGTREDLEPGQESKLP